MTPKEFENWLVKTIKYSEWLPPNERVHNPHTAQAILEKYRTIEWDKTCDGCINSDDRENEVCYTCRRYDDKDDNWESK